MAALGGAWGLKRKKAAPALNMLEPAEGAFMVPAHC
jgi:hypothetical protein